MSRVPGVIFVLLAAFSLSAQAPSDDWRTVTTEHFRVHYPASYEAWSLRAASRLESVHAAVAREVGFVPDTPVDVIVSNPIAAANGLAFPLLDAPRIMLFTEPPGPDEQIGAYSNWIDLLTAHEVTHIVHMLRPSRNPMLRTIERIAVPIGPITLAAPRWVLEGYATVIEGRLTGAGRPPGTMRAVILREWASTGRLPSYSQLNSDQRFLGMSMAYLAGSAYLEWLELRTGPDSLRNLWARLTARRRRTFDEAFTGVFGDTPANLYGQFAAELTASAIAVNRAGELREGQLWQITPRASGDPAVSIDGEFIAVVLRKKNQPANLVVWPTADPANEEKLYAERLGKILARDPEDVAPVRAKPLPRKPLHSLTLADGGDIENPRWMHDGRAILFTHRQPDANGFLHYDLFLWTPQSGDVTRVTSLADVSDADPLPDGLSAIAVRSRYGFSQLVRVDLGSGSVTPLTDETLDRVESHPRVSRDGSMLVYVSHRRGVWRLVRRNLSTGSEEEPGSSDFNYASPEWSGTGDLYAIASRGGFSELHRVAGATTVPVTRSSSGAFSPAPARDGRVFFMNLEPDGFNVHVIDGRGEAAASPAFDIALVPAVPPPAASATPFASQGLPPSRPYGIGGQEFATVFGGAYGPSQIATELGVRFGDVVGRLNTLLLGSFANEDAQRGFALSSAWRGWPVAVSAHAFTSEDDDRELDGVELRGSWTRRGPRSTFSFDGGGLTGKPFDIGFVETALGTRFTAGSLRSNAEVRASAEVGSTDHHRLIASGGVRSGSIGLAVRLQRDEVTGGDEPLEIGGLNSSIVARSAFATRVIDPALPVRTLVSDSYKGARVELTLAALPFTTFYQRHEVPGSRVSLAGIEVALRSEPFPILKLPAFNITAGVARILDDPLDNDMNWWFGLQWLP